MVFQKFDSGGQDLGPAPQKPCKNQYCVIHHFEVLVEVLHEVQPQPVEGSPSRRLDRPAKVEETCPYYQLDICQRACAPHHIKHTLCVGLW